MFGLIASLYQQCRGSAEYNLCILGINETGKTVLFNTIKHMDQNQAQNQDKSSTLITYRPTVGLNVVKYKKGIERFVIWDLGGKPGIRKIWQNYYSECHGLLYVINHNIDEGIQALKGILLHQQMAKIPVAVISTSEADRQQIQNDIDKLQCLKDRKYKVYCLPLDKMHYMKANIKEILSFLYSHVRDLHEQLKQ